MKNSGLTLLIVLFALPSMGCLEWWPELGVPAGEQPWGELNPVQYAFYAMHDSPAREDQEKGMKVPPAGAVSVEERVYPYSVSDLAAAAALKNPVAIDEQSLKYGQMMYETTCIVCHGAKGLGAGYIIPKYPKPPSLTSAKLRDWPDGKIYHVISNGKGRMWSYKSQLTPMERWSVVNYVRALQRAEYPEPEDLERTQDL